MTDPHLAVPLPITPNDNQTPSKTVDQGVNYSTELCFAQIYRPIFSTWKGMGRFSRMLKATKIITYDFAAWLV